MADLDTQALSDRFFAFFDEDDAQIIVDNQPASSVDRTKPWCRFSVQPGAEAPDQRGSNTIFLRLGVAYLQIFVPQGMGTGPGDDLRDKFFNTFRDWRSDDKALRVRRTDESRISGTDKPYQINARIDWESTRARTQN